MKMTSCRGFEREGKEGSRGSCGGLLLNSTVEFKIETGCEVAGVK